MSDFFYKKTSLFACKCLFAMLSWRVSVFYIVSVVAAADGFVARGG